MKYYDIIDLVEANKQEYELERWFWESMLTRTKMTEEQVKFTLVYLLDFFMKKYKQDSLKIQELQKQVETLKDDVKTLQAKTNTSNNELAVSRAKNSKKIAKTANKEAVQKLKKLGMSNVDICKALHISRSTLWRYMKE